MPSGQCRAQRQPGRGRGEREQAHGEQRQSGDVVAEVRPRVRGVGALAADRRVRIGRGLLASCPPTACAARATSAGTPRATSPTLARSVVVSRAGGCDDEARGGEEQHDDEDGLGLEEERNACVERGQRAAAAEAPRTAGEVARAEDERGAEQERPW